MRRKLAVGVVMGISAAVGYGLRVDAEGAPLEQPLFYSGTLEDNGAAAEGGYEIALRVYDAESGGNELCISDTPAVPIKGGRFRVDASSCATAMRSHSETWVAVSFTGGDGLKRDLPRAKVGAVPYALEADRARRASDAEPGGRLAASLIPSGMIGMFTAACPDGWSACDGSGACPNLMGGFIKAGSEFAPLSGTNSHAHTTPAGTTGAGGSVTPVVASAKADKRGAHSHLAMIDFTGNSVVERTEHAASGSDGANVPVQWFSKYTIVAGASWTEARLGPFDAGVLTTTDPGHEHPVTVTMSPLPAHSHSVPEQATNTVSHEPRGATLVLCMKQ